MTITFHSKADTPSEFRAEVVAELRRRLELARGDANRAATANGRNIYLGRVNELSSLVDFFETLRMKGETH